MWVPLVEYGEAESRGADFFVKRHIDSLLLKDPDIDTILLGCTHYPLLYPKIRHYTPENVQIIPQGQIVAESLKDYLERHSDLAGRCSRGGTMRFLTTENPEKFSSMASTFISYPVKAEKI